MDDLTVDEVKAIVTEHKTKFIPVHNCSFCGYECGYVIPYTVEDGIWYDSGCTCSRRGPAPYKPSTWESIANHYNMQNSIGRVRVMSKLKNEAR